jgi:hypothetical protein
MHPRDYLHHVGDVSQLKPVPTDAAIVCESASGSCVIIEIVE